MNIPALIRILGAKGMSAEEIADVIELASPKSTGAERTRRWREKKEAGNAVTVTSRDVTDVTPVTKDAPAPTYTRGEDNPSRLDNIPNLTSPYSASAPDLDWPEGDKPSKAYLDRLEDALREAAGPALASPAVAPKVRVLAPILALGRGGKGPPCDLQADVLPTVRARCARAPPGSVKGWDYFTEAIREARDKRLTGAPAIEPVHQGQRHERPSPRTHQPSHEGKSRADQRQRAALSVLDERGAFGDPDQGPGGVYPGGLAGAPRLAGRA